MSNLLLSPGEGQRLRKLRSEYPKNAITIERDMESDDYILCCDGTKVFGPEPYVGDLLRKFDEHVKAIRNGK